MKRFLFAYHVRSYLSARSSTSNKTLKFRLSRAASVQTTCSFLPLDCSSDSWLSFELKDFWTWLSLWFYSKLSWTGLQNDCVGGCQEYQRRTSPSSCSNHDFKTSGQRFQTMWGKRSFVLLRTAFWQHVPLHQPSEDCNQYTDILMAFDLPQDFALIIENDFR